MIKILIWFNLNFKLDSDLVWS